MAEEDISQISVGEFETVAELLASSESLQFAFIILRKSSFFADKSIQILLYSSTEL